MTDTPVMTQDIRSLALRYASAKAAVGPAEANLAEFTRMVDQWSGQRAFRWAGVNLTMDDAAVATFRRQLEDEVAGRKKILDEIEAELTGRVRDDNREP